MHSALLDGEEDTLLDGEEDNEAVGADRSSAGSDAAGEEGGVETGKLDSTGCSSSSWDSGVSGEMGSVFAS